MIHRADVLKDRTWALNGKVIRWSDKANYQPGGYAQVWNSLKPHFDRVQQTMAIVTLKTGTSSADLALFVVLCSRTASSLLGCTAKSGKAKHAGGNEHASLL